ncbi:MAG: SBBP repeat-containing protein [Chitinophagales bacterium]
MSKYLFCAFLILFVIKIPHAQQLNSFTISDKGFIKNEGQILDEKGRKNKEVKFLYAGKKFNIQLRQNGFSYEAFQEVRTNSIHNESGTTALTEGYIEGITRIISNRVDVNFKGANAHPALIAEDPSEALFNYYVTEGSHSAIAGVPCYHRLTWQNLYRGIDLVFSFHPENKIAPVEYSFIIHPGAIAAQIRMMYQGASGLFLTAEEDFGIAMNIGEVRETELKAFIRESGAAIHVARKISDNQVEFQIDRSEQTIVIDPNIIWGTYYGGEAYDYVGEVDHDNFNKVIIAGYTESYNHIATSGAFQSTYMGNYDMFIAKFKETGKIEWATYFGGTDNDICYTVTTDKNSNIIIGGKSQSGDQITTPGAYDETGGLGGDMMLAKFTKKGLLTWCTLIGGEGPEHFRKIICDSKGNIYAAGYTESATGIKLNNKNPSEYVGEGDAFLVKFSPGGFPSWSAYYGGNGQDRIHGIARDQFGNIYIQGTTESDSGISTPGAFQTTYGGNGDAFISKMDSTGNVMWSTYYGGTAEDHGRGVVCSKKNSIYITGYGASAHVFGTPNTRQPNINSETDQGGNYSEDGFVAKFNYDGSRIWGTYYGGRDPDELLGIDLDDSAYVYVGGVTSSWDSITLPGAFQKQLSPETNDGYFGKFDTLGHLLYGTYLGGTGNERMEDITCGRNNNLYLAYTHYGFLPVTPGTWQTVTYGDQECAVYRFNISKYCFDNYEPNDDQANARVLNVTSDTTLYGFIASIASPTDEDWYLIKTTAAESNLKITLTDLTKFYSIELYNSSAILIATSVAEGNEQVLKFNNLSAATYYIRIKHDAVNYGLKDCYRLLVWKSSTPFLGGNVAKSFNINDQGSDVSISIYPNPVSRELLIKGHSATNYPADICVYNILNEVVFKERITIQAGYLEEKISLPVLSPGNYLFEWKQNNSTYRERLIIQ